MSDNKQGVGSMKSPNKPRDMGSIIGQEGSLPPENNFDVPDSPIPGPGEPLETPRSWLLVQDPIANGFEFVGYGVRFANGEFLREVRTFNPKAEFVTTTEDSEVLVLPNARFAANIARKDNGEIVEVWQSSRQHLVVWGNHIPEHRRLDPAVLKPYRRRSVSAKRVRKGMTSDAGGGGGEAKAERNVSAIVAEKTVPLTSRDPAIGPSAPKAIPQKRAAVRIGVAEPKGKARSAVKAAGRQRKLPEIAPEPPAPAESESVSIKRQLRKGELDDAVSNVATENSIELNKALSKEVESQQGPSSPVVRVVEPTAAATTPSGVRSRFFSTLSRAIQNAGVWLSKMGTEVEPGRDDLRQPVAKSESAGIVSLFPASSVDKSTIVPEAVAQRFLKVGNDYYFFDKTLAFSDRGTKLSTQGAKPDVVRSLVEIAVSRGWGSITVRGTEEFRRSAWMGAAENGLQVIGYTPSVLDLAELNKRPAHNSVERVQIKEKNLPEKRDLKDGPQKEPDTSTSRLPEAQEESRRAASRPDLELAKKAKAFVENKPAFVVKKYPDLAGAYGLVEAARAFAVENLPEASREKFVGMARDHAFRQIFAGETVKGPKIHLSALGSIDKRNQAKAPAQGEPELQRRARSNEIVPER